MANESSFSENLKKQAGHIDWYIFLPVVALMLFSIAFVYSASYAKALSQFGSSEGFFFKHALRIVIGIALLIIFAKIDYHVWKKYSKILLLVSIGLLVYVLFAGSVMMGAKRWIDIGPITFQPSELTKFCMVIHFAAMLSVKQKVIKSFEKGFIPFMLWIVVISVLIALQPNFSTMAVIGFIAFLMMFIGNVNLLYLMGSGAFAVFIGFVYMLSAEYRRNRLLAFLGMGDDSNSTVENVSYQLNQALLAIGNGGLFGVGPGQSRQSHSFLPESFGDFIFSIIGEEFGFFGLAIIIAAFILIFWRGMMVAKNAPDNFGYFLSVGILITFAIYVFVNAGVNTGILPTTGVPMPFISYGGTAVLIYAAAMGILLNISAQANVYPKHEKTQNTQESMDN